MKTNNLIFLSFIIITILCFWSTYIYKAGTNNYKIKSIIENRTYNNFKDVELKGFFTNNFQSSLESALSDQFLFSEKIRSRYNKFLNILDYKNIAKEICKNKYVFLNRYTAMFDCAEYLLYPFNYFDYEMNEEFYSHNMKIFNEINNKFDTYFYYIDTSSDFDFENNFKRNVKEHLDKYFDAEYKFEEFQFMNFDDYKKNMYKTDIHWNQDASYRGYVDIINMITNDKAKDITFTHYYNDTNFYGYLAREIKYFGFKEKVKYHYIELDEHKTYTNGVENPIDDSSIYLNGSYSRDEYAYHYAYLSGINYGFKLIDYNRPDKENLLIFIDSFANPILQFIGSHFNKTHAINLRYLDETINLEQYTKEHDIDKILVILNTYTFSKYILNLEV